MNAIISSVKYVWSLRDAGMIFFAITQATMIPAFVRLRRRERRQHLCMAVCACRPMCMCLCVCIYVHPMPLHWWILSTLTVKPGRLGLVAVNQDSPSRTTQLASTAVLEDCGSQLTMQCYLNIGLTDW